jgi:hypothetical protein
MSYFEGLKLTKKGEQLQAKINGNLSETLTFTKAKLGSGSITSNDEIRFLTDVKEEWGTANVASCKIQGDENNIVAIELQFSNAGLREDKIFREIGLYARGNEGDEILYAYANAGDKYDYIPLMKDSPHSFVIVIYFNITSGTKVDANIDLYSYITLQKFNEEISKKENIISKKSGFNLEKTDSFKEDDTNKLATAKALKSLHDEVDRKTGAIKLNWDSIKDKPSSFVPSEHNHNSLYYTETEVDEKLENNILYSTGKTYGGLLNEPGVKSAGKAYWDNNTKKLYICKNNNSDISPNINNYIPFDNGSILERLENLNTKSNGDIASVTSFRLGFNASSALNTSKINNKKIVYVTVKTDDMYISTLLPKNINRAMLIHGKTARTAILAIEDTGFWLYGDITGMTGIYLSEYVYY